MDRRTYLVKYAFVLFGPNGDTEPVALRGASELLALNFNGGAITGVSFDINMEWTEEIN